VPRIPVVEKTQRDRDMIAALPRFLAGKKRVILGGTSFSLARLRKVFEKHLQAMARVRVTTAARRQAVADERVLEKELQALLRYMKTLASSRVGRHDLQMRAYAFAPDKKPKMTPETKARANVKRQATRKERGIGKKHRRSR
jgi:hypothetical protein